MILAAAACAACTACGSGGADAACGPSAAIVARVVDGDTVLLEGGELVRYLLVDTPETDACFGAEAAALNRELTAGRAVTLAYDAAACRDRYDRLLAYVAVDGRDVNALLVERGHACVLFLPPAGAARHDELVALEAAARAGHRGLWGVCEVASCD